MPFVQILQREVPEAGLTQDCVAVAHRPRRDHDPSLRITLREAGDLVHDLLAVGPVEDLVQPIEEHQRRTALQRAVEPLVVQEILLGPPQVQGVVQE